MKTYVLYHSNCYDGLGAAYAAWKRLGDKGVEYIPVGYGKEPPEMEPGSAVYILDMSYSPETIAEMASKHEFITLLDHHKSAMLQWTGKDYDRDFYHQDGIESPNGMMSNVMIMFDMKVSGAGFAWDFFCWNPESGRNERPKFIDLIEDRDLWKFTREETKAFHSYLLSIPQDFRSYSKFEDDVFLNNAIEQGRALLRMTDQIVENICKNSYESFSFLGHRVAVVNTSSHWSEVGNRLLEMWPEVDFACSYTDLGGGIRMFSLRSRGDFDVSLIANSYGGGGHKGASGFKARLKVPFENIEYETIKHK